MSSISPNLGMKLDDKVVHTTIIQKSKTTQIDKWKWKKSFKRNYFFSIEFRMGSLAKLQTPFKTRSLQDQVDNKKGNQDA